MNINYLRYALEVQKTGSITQAAENLFMSQPNLSRDIKELEASLNISVFSRTSRGVVTTSEGEEFLEYAKNLLDHMNEIESKYSKSRKKKVSFSISIPRASYIAEAVSVFINEIEDELGENFFVNVKETNAVEAVNNITELGYDFGVIRYPVMYESYFHTLLEGKNLEHDELVNLQYVVLVSENSKLAGRNTVTLDELKSYIEIVHGDLTVPYLSLANNIQDLTPSQNSPRKLAVFERGSQFCLLQNVTASYMWASPMTKEDLKSHGLREIHCPEADDQYIDALIYQKKKNSGLNEKLIKTLKDVIVSAFREF
ncbi:MAG: LysR family transcriptional regulator [Eubacteriaceae bacterium]|nr:LysR family transcriptional regulator [Eubacteriaceae bacterium]